MKPLNEKEFEKLVKRYGCKIKPTTKHYEILGREGLQIMVLRSLMRKVQNAMSNLFMSNSF